MLHVADTLAFAAQMLTSVALGISRHDYSSNLHHSTQGALEALQLLQQQGRLPTHLAPALSRLSAAAQSARNPLQKGGLNVGRVTGAADAQWFMQELAQVAALLKAPAGATAPAPGTPPALPLVSSSARFAVTMNGTVGEIQLIGNIDWWANGSAEFTRRLADLRAAGVMELRGYINSGGGSLFDGNEIHNQIAAFPGRKTCQIGALAASAATVVACAFSDGIEMAANGQYMIHNPELRAQGGEKELNSALQLYENVRQAAIATYVKRTGLSADEVAGMMERTTWMNAATAKEKGFITAITGEENSAPAMRTGTAPRMAADRANWSILDWMEKDGAGLEQMRATNLKGFTQLYRAQFGPNASY